MPPDPPYRLYAARALLAANGLLWLILAAVTVGRPWASGVVLAPASYVLALLMLGNALALFGLALWLRPESTTSLVAAAVWVTVNLALSITDQVGVMDVLVAILNAVTLAAIGNLRRRAVG
jgi:hypothetical protein